MKSRTPRNPDITQHSDMKSFIQEAKMNETWLHSSPPGFQPLHSATHQFTIQLTVPMEIGT